MKRFCAGGAEVGPRGAGPGSPAGRGGAQPPGLGTPLLEELDDANVVNSEGDDLQFFMSQPSELPPGVDVPRARAERKGA